jgi:SAM-dependent methyltransferase
MLEWEKIYDSGKQINLWPYTELASKFSKYFKNGEPLSKQINVLELGCGAGNNSRLFSDDESNYEGVDFSKSAIQFAKSNYQNRSTNFLFADLVEHDFPIQKFDLIFDRAAVTHLLDSQIRTLISKAFKALKDGGLYFGIDWFSTSHPEFNSNECKKIGKLDRTSYKTGKFQGVGTVHFSDKEFIESTFYEFRIMEISENRTFNYGTGIELPSGATWSFVAKKG